MTTTRTASEWVTATDGSRVTFAVTSDNMVSFQGIASWPLATLVGLSAAGAGLHLHLGAGLALDPLVVTDVVLLARELLDEL